MNRTLTTTLLAAALALGASVAQAATPTGTYVGVGATRVDINDGPIDDNDVGYTAFGGYRFNDYFGLEATYSDGATLDTAAGDLELSSIGAYAVGYLPVNDRVDLFAKAGWQSWDTDARNAFIGEDSGTDLAYGLGAQYRFTEAFGVRGEWTRLEIEDTEADAFTVAATWNF